METEGSKPGVGVAHHTMESLEQTEFLQIGLGDSIGSQASGKTLKRPYSDIFVMPAA